MSKRWVLPVAILVIGLFVATWYQSIPSQRAGFTAPDFALPDLSGRIYRLSGFRGKVVFLNLWTTWCPPCRMEMPAMESLYRRFEGEDFVMLAVNQDETGEAAVQPFLKELRLTFPILMDPQARVSHQYGVTGYPETFIIDRQGRVVEHFIGPEEWDSRQSQLYFAALLRTSGASDGAGTKGGTLGQP